VQSRFTSSALLVSCVLILSRGGQAAPASLYPLTVLSDNPSAYWRLDEAGGNVAHDWIVGHDCLLTKVQLGVPGYSASDPDKAAVFGLLAASNSYASELDNAASGIANLDFAQPAGSNAEFSIEVWVQGNAQSQDAGIVTKGYGNGGEQFTLDTGSDKVASHGFRFFERDATGSVHSAGSTVAPDGQWHHLVGVCDEPQGWVHIYVDGLESTNSAVPVGAGLLATAGGSAPGTALVSIGARTSRKTATSFNYQFVGTIDEVAIYGYALSAGQVMAHYEAGLAALRFTNLTLRGTSITLTGSGGLSNTVFTLVAATNLALPFTNWTALATNSCDSAGRFSLTNPVASSAPRRFYALQIEPPSDALWIPPCGAWLGAEVTNGTAQAFSDHEARIGRQLDIPRKYHTPGSWTALTSDELGYINAKRKLFVSFKPDSHWSNAVGVANGGSATVDSQMTSLARSVAGIKPRKIMLCVWHEPENDVGSAGTTNQYVAMWHNVRGIFDSNGATNVIWCWVIENYAPFHYLLPGLWPGNSYVDWVGWDVYQGSASVNYVAAQIAAYNYLVNNSDAVHSYTSKPWAWGEWGVGINGWFPTAAQQSNTFIAVSAAINARHFPRVRYLAYFDTDAGPNASSAILPGAWGAYSNLANSPYLTQQSAR
jgi:hypothetical protein